MSDLMKKAEQHNNNCAPVTLSALVGVDYDTLWKFINDRGWFCPIKGMRDCYIISTLYHFGFKTKLQKGVFKIMKGTWANWKKNHMDPTRKYLVFFKGHVAAVVNGEIYDTAHYRGMARVELVYEVVSYDSHSNVF